MRASGERPRRIIVDCSHIAPHPAPTGIPRVVMNYVEHGTPVAARAGVEVLCAEAGPDGFHLRDLGPIAAAEVRARKPIGLKLKLEAARYGARLLAALARLAAALVPARGVRRAMAQLEAFSLDMVPAMQRRRAVRRSPPGRRLELGPGDILFCPGYWHDTETSAYARARAAGAEVVFLVHDILPVTMPAHYVYPWRQEFEARLSASLDVVSHYYCISGETLRSLKAHAAWQGHSPRASIAYNGFDPEPPAHGEVPAALDAVLAEAPWLMVGTLEPKKGHEDAIAVFSHLWSAGYARPLVLIGRRGWMSEPIRDIIQTSPWLGTRLFWFDGLDDGAVAAAYRKAHALLFASEAEGFGLPLLEAVSHGVPVVTRDIAVAREVLGEGDFYFKGRAGLIAALTALESPVRRAAVRERQARIAWWDWASVAEAVVTDLMRAPDARGVGEVVLDPSRRRPVVQARKSGMDGEMPKKVASIR